MQGNKSDKEIYLEILRMAREINPEATTEELIEEAKRIEGYVYAGLSIPFGRDRWSIDGTPQE